MGQQDNEQLGLLLQHLPRQRSDISGSGNSALIQAGVWYYMWVIPHQGPIFRRGNGTQAVALITQQGLHCPPLQLLVFTNEEAQASRVDLRRRRPS